MGSVVRWICAKVLNEKWPLRVLRGCDLEALQCIWPERTWSMVAWKLQSACGSSGLTSSCVALKLIYADLGGVGRIWAELANLNRFERIWSAVGGCARI